MKTLGFALVSLFLGTAWMVLTQALVKVGVLSGDGLSRDAGIVSMMIFLSMACWFKEEK